MTFEEFLSTELEPLRRYARLLTGNRDSAHDVLADALIKAHLRWNRIGRMEFPAAYVRSMVTNGYISEKRRWSTRFISLTRTGELPVVTGPPASRSVDDRDRLEQLLVELPHQQRAAIVLRYLLDLSDAAIAAELRCSSGAVRSYISRGLSAIREREDIPARRQGDLLTPMPRALRADKVGERR